MRRTMVVAVVAAGALLAAGCGGSSGNGESSKTGPQVASDAAQALQDAGAVHVSGAVTASGKQQQLDVQLQGTDGSGEATVDGQRVNFVKTAGKAYFKAPASFWQGTGVPAQTASAIDNKWVVVPEQAQDALDDMTIDGLAKELRSPSDGPFKDDVRTDTLDGKRVVVLTQENGSETYVAATGKPYPLKVVNKGDDAGALTLDGFGKQQSIAPPPNPIDPNQPAGQAA